MRDKTSDQTATRRARAPRRRRAAAVLAGLALCCGAHAAGGWQWLDGSGRKVFSDMPPPASVPEKNILQRPPSPAYGATLAPATPDPPASAPAAPSRSDSSDTPSPRRGHRSKGEVPELNDAELRAAVDKRNGEIRQNNCRRAREDLAALASGTRLLVSNERGEPVVLDEERQAAEIRRLRRSEQDNCPPRPGTSERGSAQ